MESRREPTFASTQTLGPIRPAILVSAHILTSAEWSMAAYGSFSQSYTVLTIYSNLGREGLVHGMGEGEVPLVVTNAALLAGVRSPSLHSRSGSIVAPTISLVLLHLIAS